MLPPFDIFRVEEDGQLLWQDTAHTLALARLRVKLLSANKRADYVIFSQETGHKSVVRQGEAQGEHPICPTHETFMVTHCFQSWELSDVEGTLDGFRCANLSCPIVYIEALEGFHVLADGKFTRMPGSKKDPNREPS